MKQLITTLCLLVFFGSMAQSTFLHCGKVIDTKNGKVLTNKTIVIQDKKITAIHDGFMATKRADDIIIDLKDKTVMPGWIDMHVHIEGETSPTCYLDGYT